MKTIRLLLLLACPCAFAQSLTTISDTIYSPFNGRLMNGICTITPVGVGSGSVTFGAIPQTVTVTFGGFYVQLQPNDVAIPANSYYSVRCQPQGQTAWTETWSVPTSNTPLTIRYVRNNAAQVTGQPLLTGKGQLLTRNSSGYSVFGPGSDGQLLVFDSSQTSGMKGAFFSLDGLTGLTQTFVAGSNSDANLTLNVNSSGTQHTWTVGWNGALAKGRQYAGTAYTDQNETFGAYSFDFSGAAAFRAGTPDIGATPVVGRYTCGVGGCTAGLLVKLAPTDPTAKASGTNSIVVTTAITDSGAHGVSLDTVAAGAVVRVASYGQYACTSDGVIANGDEVGNSSTLAGHCSDLGQSSSTLVSTSTGYIGKAESAASGAGQSINVQIDGPGHHGTGYQPAGTGAIARTVAAELGDEIKDVQYSTLANACTAATTAGKKLRSLASWTSVPGIVCSAPVRADQGSVIQPAASALISLLAFDGDLTKHFDVSLGGVVTILHAPMVYPEWWGAKEDGRYISGVGLSSGLSTVTSSSIVSSDVGKVIELSATGIGGTGVNLIDAVISNVSGTTITLSNLSASIAITGSATAWYATDDTAAIQAAINSLNPLNDVHGRAGVVWLNSESAITATLLAKYSGITIEGIGWSSSVSSTPTNGVGTQSMIRWMGPGQANPGSLSTWNGPSGTFPSGQAELSFISVTNGGVCTGTPTATVQVGNSTSGYTNAAPAGGVQATANPMIYVPSSVTVTGVTTGTTTTYSVSNAAGFFQNGSVAISGTSSTGGSLNSTQTVTAVNTTSNTITTSLNSSAITYVSGGAMVGTNGTIRYVAITNPGWGYDYVGNTAPATPQFPQLTFTSCSTAPTVNVAVGFPEVKTEDGFGFNLVNLRIVGNSASNPSAGFEAVENSPVLAPSEALDYTSGSFLWFGPVNGNDIDTGTQFGQALVLAGHVDGNSNYFEQITATNAWTCVNVSNANASPTQFNILTTQNCGIGLGVGALVTAHSYLASDNSIVDIDMEGGALEATNFNSEKSSVMLVMNQTQSRAHFIGGGWEAYTQASGPQVSPDGNIIIGIQGNLLLSLLVENFGLQLQGSPSYTGPTPKVYMYNTAGGVTSNNIVFDQVTGWSLSNFNLGSLVSANDFRKFRFCPAGSMTCTIDPYAWNSLTRDRSLQVGVSHAFGEQAQEGSARVDQIPNPGALSCASGTGTTSYYKIEYATPSGAATLASGETACAAANGTISITWPLGATSAYIYKGTSGSGSEVPYDTMSAPTVVPGTLTYADTGSAQGAVPPAFATSNGTGDLTVNVLNAGQINGSINLGTVVFPSTSTGDILCSAHADGTITFPPFYSAAACGNQVSDGTTATAFATTYTFASGIGIGHQYEICADLQDWSNAATNTTTNFMLFWGASQVSKTASITETASLAHAGYKACWTITAVTSTYLVAEPEFLATPGMTFAGQYNQASIQPQNLSTTASTTVSIKTIYGANGLASATYVSGGTISGTGTCALTAFNNGGASTPSAVLNVSSGTVTGITVTGTGYGFTAAATSATATGSGTGGQATCSGTVTITSVLGGSQGTAHQLNLLTIRQLI